ncbi:hypothetical protein C1646_777739 [Rhizophagus diaphanus]|nr:hypothetical protein C1646_777739 [Rhizophagus diaphanus] [Rhizophagus sp. MUCL 43196]
MAKDSIIINEELVEENLTASEIRYYLEFQEYPNTSETGFASIFNISGWDEDEERKAFALTNIQYSYGGNGTIRTCQYASKELDIGHTSIDFSTPLFENIFNANEEFHKKTTLRFFAKAYDINVAILTKMENDVTVNGLISSKKKFIGCENWKAGDKNHQFLTIPNNIDLELLETMFNEDSYYSHNNDFEELGWVA